MVTQKAPLTFNLDFFLVILRDLFFCIFKYNGSITHKSSSLPENRIFKPAFTAS